MTVAEVLIVGAGPTGLALAAQLQAFGVTPRIVEQRVSDQPSRAFVVQPRTLEVLAPTGVADRLVEAGNPSATVVVHAGRRRAALPMSIPGRRSDDRFPFLLAIPQVEVEAVLDDHLASHGVRVERGVRLNRLEPTGHGARCELTHPGGRVEQVEVPWLVGCDGRDSLVRTGAGFAFPARTYRQRLLLADVVLDTDLDRHAVHGLLDRRGAVFLFPFPDGESWRLLSVLDPEDAGGDLAAAAASDLERASRGRARLRALRWIAPVELRRGQADSYRRGGVLLAGDAAHVHSPAGAQGMNTGLQDAVNLGWKLALVATGTASADLLDTYQTERWPVARWTRRLTDVAFFFEAGGGGVLAGLRSRVGPVLVPLVDRRAMPAPMFHLLGGLHTGYRPSQIAVEGEPRLRRGVRAGRRLPDGEVVSDRGRGRLHDLLSPPGFHLLVFDAVFDTAVGAAPAGPIGPVGPVPVHRHHIDLAATAGTKPGAAVLGRLGVQGPAAYLIRPDGYIGYRAATSDLTGVRRYLDRLGDESPA